MMPRKHGWIGIVDGCALAERVIDAYGESKQIIVFISRKEARKRFQKVQKIKFYKATASAKEVAE